MTNYQEYIPTQSEKIDMFYKLCGDIDTQLKMTVTADDVRAQCKILDNVSDMDIEMAIDGLDILQSNQ